MTQDWRAVLKEIRAIAEEREYSGMMKETLYGIVDMAEDRDAATQELLQILSEETVERTISKMLQPIIKAQIEERQEKSRKG